MQAYRIETTVTQDGTLTLKDLPLRSGETVEVIILVQAPARESAQPYPLRGKLVHYDKPMEPVAETEWDALQ